MLITSPIKQPEKFLHTLYSPVQHLSGGVIGFFKFENGLFPNCDAYREEPDICMHIYTQTVTQTHTHIDTLTYNRIYAHIDTYIYGTTPCLLPFYVSHNIISIIITV